MRQARHTRLDVDIKENMAARIPSSPRRRRSAKPAGKLHGGSSPPGRKNAKGREASAVLRHVRELFRVSQEHFRRIEARCGVSGVQVWAVAELRAKPGMTISELARALSIHLSTASNLLDRMEGNRLVRRERGAKDQRIVHVFVTRAGERMLRRAPEPAEGVIPDALDRMPVAALHRLDRDLGKLLALARIRNLRAAMKPLAEP